MLQFTLMIQVSHCVVADYIITYHVRDLHGNVRNNDNTKL